MRASTGSGTPSTGSIPDLRWNDWSARLLAPGRGLVLVGLTVVEAVLACVVTVAMALLIVAVGVFLLPGSMEALRSAATRARCFAARWSGVRIPEPHMPAPPPEPGFRGGLRRSRALISDPASWRDLLWSILDPALGWVLTALPAGLVVYGFFGAVVQPFVWELIDRAGGSNWYTAIHVDSTAAAIACVPIGVALAVLGFVVGPSTLRLHARWTALLLAPTRAAGLQQRITRLAGTRADANEDQAAELRRIERDLHDGAQARLVAMGMNLCAADKIFDQNPTAARAMLVSVREASAKALEELRDLVRGIHPPVLADRGIADAVRALALDSMLNIEVSTDLTGRPSAPVESATYFAISELLVNAAKHAHPSHVQVTLDHRDGMLNAVVTDDGPGGADPSLGSGLRGIQRRLAAFDGTAAVRSPVGGPTIVTLEVPCELSSPRTCSSSETD